jgi:phage shock protein PspC (stress-responsive transcriptional regulator)
MNKTVTVNLGGTIFNIEEEAFQLLKGYLDRIKLNFSSDPGEGEIMQDIEVRLAELFSERLDEKRNVVIKSHVEEVIAIMGQPEDYAMGTTTSADEADASNFRHTKRRVYRDGDDAVIGGVCSGLSYYFGWDPIVLRIAFAIFGIISGGTAIIAYIILWALVPEAKTTAEKLQMRGEKVNVDSISRFINMEAKKASDNVNKWSEKGFKGSARNTNTSEVMKGVGTAFSKIIGAFLVVGGFSLLGLLLSIFVFAEFSFGNQQMPFEQLHLIFFGDTGNYWMLVLGTLLTLGVPAVALLYSGFKLLIGSTRQIKGLGWSLAGLFVLGICLATIGGVRIGREFSSEAELRESRPIDVAPGDTLFVDVMPDSVFIGRTEDDRDNFLDLVNITPEFIHYGQTVSVGFEQAEGSEYSVRVVRESRGPGKKRAGELVSNISYEWSVVGDTLSLAPWLKTPATDQFRGQEVEITIYIPHGRQVKFGQHIGLIHWDEEKAGQTRMMWNDDWWSNDRMEDEEMEEPTPPAPPTPPSDSGTQRIIIQ